MRNNDIGTVSSTLLVLVLLNCVFIVVICQLICTCIVVESFLDLLYLLLLLLLDLVLDTSGRREIVTLPGLVIAASSAPAVKPKLSFIGSL